MGLANKEHWRDEKINGVVYDMSPAPEYRHGIVNGNIYAAIKQALKNSICLVSIENLDFKYHPEENDDSYSGTPKFIAETLSPSTVKRDRIEKKEIYEKAGVEEYWIVFPQGKSVEVYYLQEGKYVLEQAYILQDDIEDEDYNAQTEISLKAFPNIKMTLSEIFESMD